MKDQFDELAKGLAQSVTRRAALKKFGLGLAGMAILALVGLPRRADATTGPGLNICQTNRDCPKGTRCRKAKGQIYGTCV